ncbi:outer membrane protein transport protein [Luteolibacter flavescens]|uniref:Outer membrane protein transport protein n=1 Tax=Luteolibacter flavescens TaxID=1859460 RepID=A0ABT3FMJ0_9BACT|nr:outer membrane protein transport protein [Luteolibacter flavescens]MCW1884791.1 outer membrane protein transport protein [Luteolibacter flavescens]
MNTRLVLCSLGLVSPLCHGAGFQLHERSASGLGRAFSGEAAIADDASVIASNPAGMILLEDEWSFAIGTSAIFPEIEVSGTYAPPAPAPPGTVVPAHAGNVTDEAYIPYLYLAKRLNDDFSIGFGAYTTFGLKSDYPLSFPGRTVADFSELVSFNLNPSLAWRITDQWSIGAGYNALHGDGSLTATLPNGLPTLDLAGDDWGHGYNLGLLYQATESTRFGLHYRSKIDLELEGRAVSVIPAFNGRATLAVELPASVEFSAVHDFEDWSIHGDVLWTDWSTFQQLAPHIIGAPAQPPVTRENWKDTWRFAVGTTWRASETWTFRAGVAYDRAPANEADITLRIPDADRFWLSAGFSWEFTPCWTLDVGYTHIFADDVFITDGSAATGVFQGKAAGSGDIVSIGLSAGF